MRQRSGDGGSDRGSQAGVEAVGSAVSENLGPGQAHQGEIAQ